MAGTAERALFLISLSEGRRGGLVPTILSALGRLFTVDLTFSTAPCKLPNALEIDAMILSERL
jgi:hypothetical protein